MKTKVIILAGGMGSRMRSDTHKSLHRLSEKTMLEHILDGVLPIDSCPVIIVGHKGEVVVSETGNRYQYVWQSEPLGTGHAVQCAKETLLKEGADFVVVVPGDAPLVTEETLRHLISDCEKQGAAVSLAVASVPSFEGLYAGFARGGRIIRDGKAGVRAIVEWKDADEEERAIREVNAGFYCFRADFLWENIDKIKNTNASKEFYLTDIIAIAVEAGEKVSAVVLENPLEGLGVNTQEELLAAEKAKSSPT